MRLTPFLILALALGVAHAQEMRDPTRPASLGPGPVLRADGVQAVRLEAVLDSGDNKRAIVNGKVVREGDRVAGVRIVSISGNSVHYVRAGQGHIARLPIQKIPVRTGATLNAGEP